MNSESSRADRGLAALQEVRGPEDIARLLVKFSARLGDIEFRRALVIRTKQILGIPIQGWSIKFLRKGGGAIVSYPSGNLSRSSSEDATRLLKGLQDSEVKVEVSYEADEPKGCHAGKDGECNWGDCPQLRDGEPEATGRHCPLDTRGRPSWRCQNCNTMNELDPEIPEICWRCGDRSREDT